jgi:hypothetical protein
MANASGGDCSRDRTAFPFVNPYSIFLSGVTTEVGRRLIDNLRTELRNEKISK